MSLKVILKDSKVYKNGKSPILLRVIKDREVKYFKIGDERFTFESKQWNEEYGLLKTDKRLTPDYVTLNKFITSKLQLAQSIIDNYEMQGIAWSVTMFGDEFTHKLLDYKVKTFIELRIKELHKQDKFNTALILKGLLTSLEQYNSQFKKLSFYNIDYEFVEGFYLYLKDRNNQDTTIGIQLRTLRGILNDAINRNMGSKEVYPFSKIYGNTRVFRISKLSRVKRKKYIPKEYVFKLNDAVLDKPHLIWAKQMFLFSFFASGINFKDMAFLTKNNVLSTITKEKERKYIVFKRKKTGEEIHIPITLQLQEIIDWSYSHTTNKNKYLLPIVTDVGIGGELLNNHICYMRKKLNKHLKTIAKELKFPDGLLNITSYYARHTYATTLLRNGAQVEKISEALGHRDIKTTQNYLDSFGDDILYDLNSDLLK